MTHSSSRLRDRRGAIVLIVMICLLVIAMIGASMAKVALAHRKQIRHEQIHRQARWLAEAGIERAAAKLQDDSGYEGETWSIDAVELAERGAADVTIRVEPQSELPGRVGIFVLAEYPRNVTANARVSKRVLIAQPETAIDRSSAQEP